VPIGLRSDLDGDELRRIARASKDGRQVRRLLALAAIYHGESGSEAARLGGSSLQIVRDWVLRFNELGPDALIDGKALGPEPLLGRYNKGGGMLGRLAYDHRQCEYRLGLLEPSAMPRVDQAAGHIVAPRPSQTFAPG